MLGRIAGLFGPIFAKEIVEIARRRRYYFTRLLYGGALLFVLFLVWNSFSWQLRQRGPNSINLMAQMAEAFFLAVSGVQFGAVFLFVPLFLCGVIASEREEQTLDLLFTTQLTNREIVLGKLGSRVAMLVLLIFGGLPVMSLIMLFGGIDPESLLRIVASTLFAILYAGAHAIYFSTITKSPLGALVRTYWWMAFWMVGVPMAIMIPVAEMSRGPSNFLLFCLSSIICTNPLGPFFLAMNRFAYDEVESYLGEWFYPFTMILPALWSLFLIWRAIVRLRLAPTPFVLLVRRLPGLREMGKTLGDASTEWRAIRREGAEWVWWGYHVLNPFWLRARRTRVYDREGHIGRIQWAAWMVAFFFFVVVAASTRDIDDEECSMAFLSCTWIAITLLTAVVAGTSLVGDRRRGFLELVLVTPLSGKAIVNGTFLSIWEHLRRIYWLPWVLCGLFILTGASVIHGVLCSLITATLYLALLILNGIACSLTAKTMPGALVATLIFPLVTLAGTPLLIGLFEDDHGPVLWVFCFVFLCASWWWWVYRRVSPGSVACFLTAVHLAMVALATCWTYNGRDDELPITAMHAGCITISMLDDHLHNSFRHFGYNWILPVFAYWIALVINLLWMWWWIISNFDRLAGRIVHREYAVIAKKPVLTSPEMQTTVG